MEHSKGSTTQKTHRDIFLTVHDKEDATLIESLATHHRIERFHRKV